MLYDLVLKSAADQTWIGNAKIDIALGPQKDTSKKANIERMVNVNDFSFRHFPAAPVTGVDPYAAYKTLQEKVDRNILKKEHIFANVIKQFEDIGVAVAFEGVEYTSTTTTTTTTTTAP